MHAEKLFLAGVAERWQHVEVVGVGREDYCNDPAGGDPAGYVGGGVPIAIMVMEEYMQVRKIRRRGRLLCWLRRILYNLMGEEAAIRGEAALWMPVVVCWCCQSSIMSNSRFCSVCGILQVGGKQTGPITPVPPEPPDVDVTDRLKAQKRPDERIVQAYNRLYGGTIPERKEK